MTFDLDEPPCTAECVSVIRVWWEKACHDVGVPIADAHITHIAPIIPTPYDAGALKCPHGVVWYMQPTSEQIARWAEDGVE